MFGACFTSYFLTKEIIIFKSVNILMDANPIFKNSLIRSSFQDLLSALRTYLFTKTFKLLIMWFFYKNLEKNFLIVKLKMNVYNRKALGWSKFSNYLALLYISNKLKLDYYN